MLSSDYKTWCRLSAGAEADIYRTMALESIRGSVAGYQTWQDAAARFRESLAERGVTGFVDKANREWNMSTYADMVATTTTMQAHLEGTANRLLEHGLDLVQISTHSDPCEKCEPWQGQVVSLTGKTPGYPHYGRGGGGWTFSSSLPPCLRALCAGVELVSMAIP